VPNPVDVIIVSYNSASVLGRCLASIADHLPGAIVRIREHGSDLSSLQQLRSIGEAHPSPVLIDVDPTNPGFGAGCNALAAASVAPWLLFLNPDAELLTWPWSAEQLGIPPSSIVGPIMTDSGPPGDHYGVRYGVGSELLRSWFRYRGPQPDGPGFVSGAAMLLDHATFDRLGGFDEQFFLFYEDIDLCFRGNDAGARTYVDNSWRVYHSRSHSTSQQFARSLHWSYESGCRFHLKWGSRLVVYRAYVLVDGSLRLTLHAVRRNLIARQAYASLVRRVAGELVRRAPIASLQRDEAGRRPPGSIAARPMTSATRPDRSP
jgi:N-acetylglucosaminyl-diphospho-decaprenol L-rhamnosyltransferase